MIYYNTAIKINNEYQELNPGANILPNVKDFPDGTMLINTPDVQLQYGSNITNGIIITWKYENEKELLILYYITCNLKEKYPDFKFVLYMPYLPNARMDRTHSKKEVFTLKYFCNIINSLNFNEVRILDVHSNVGAGLINNCTVISPEKYINQMFNDCNINPKEDYIFFPDEGSCKRYSDIPSKLGCKNIGFGIKKRDWDTGKILGLDVFGPSPEGKRVFIIDDICAYGGTVYYSAKKLKELNCRDINVFFSHCENSISQGELFDCGLINQIYTTNSICTLDVNKYPILKIYDC